MGNDPQIPISALALIFLAFSTVILVITFAMTRSGAVLIVLIVVVVLLILALQEFQNDFNEWLKGLLPP